MSQAQIPQATGAIIARAIVGRAERGAFGVLVRNMPDFDPTALLAGLRPRGFGVSLRVAMPGFPQAQARQLGDAARKAGFTEETFVTSIEGAERWRNDPAVEDTIVVIVPREIKKLHSLNRFEKLTSDELYRQVCREGLERLAVNEAQKQLWKALTHKPVTKIVPLDGLLSYYAELSRCDENEIPTWSRELLYLMGLLPDEGLFTTVAAPKIAQRLVENHRVVSQIAVLSRADRQRISRALLARAGRRGSEQLQDVYQKLMGFYREQDPARLAELTLTDVQRLLRAKAEAPEADEVADLPSTADDAPPKEKKAEARPAVRALDLLLADDQQTLTDLADAVRRALDLESDEEDADARDPETGAQLDIKRTHPFGRLVERFVGQDRWGGLLVVPAVTLEEALAMSDKAEVSPFDPNGEEWDIRGVLAKLVKSVDLDRALIMAYDDFTDSRRRLAEDVKELLLYPLVQLNSSREYFEQAERYLRAYETLVEGLKQSFEAISRIAPEGVEILCSQILALDTIVLRTDSGLKAILSPLHPLHLWKFVELSRQLRIQAGALTVSERDLLRSKVNDLPNFVTTLYVSNYISASGARDLPEAGVRDGIPFFEEFAHRYAGRDGVAPLTRLFEKFCALYPHARLGLRLAFIDPPDVEFLLKELVKYGDRSLPELLGIHVRLYFTHERSTSVGALGGGAEDEDGAERFRGIGTASQFTLEVHDGFGGIRSIAEELETHPAHVVVYFDPSNAKTLRLPRTPSLRIHPLCLPMQFTYDHITKTVRVVPASDGGVFSDHNDLRSRLSNQMAGKFFGVTAELKSEQRDLQSLAFGAAWLVIADRAQEGTLSFGVPRVSLQRFEKRDVVVYARDRGKFVSEFDRQLRRCNYTPSPKAIERLVDDLGSLLSDGLLALVAESGAGALDDRRTQGLVGTLVTSAWFKSRHPRSLVVSIDGPEARQWLELRDDGSRADLIGIVDEDDSSITVDVIEVKTYQKPEEAYQVTGSAIAGEAVNQLLNTARIVDEIFRLDPSNDRVVSPQRREILRQHLFRECFFEGRSDADRERWSNRLNELFALEVKIRLRLSLVVVGLTQTRASSERMLRADGRDVRLVELAEEEVRRHVSDAVPPRPASPRPPVAAPATPKASRDEDDVESRRGETPPPLTTTHTGPETEGADGLDREEQAFVASKALELRRVLKDHGIQVQELDPQKAQIGPSVIRFRVRVRAGTKVATLRTRAEDIGRELASRTTPFIDNIPGENFVGIDLERARRRTVPLLPAIGALPNPAGLSLPVAVGVSPSGEHVQLDLVELPHLLVAGSTLSGKTVFLHAVLLSLIAKLSNEQLELLIIDPKATDFVLYNGLPYLRGGRVFTEPEDAIEQLQHLTNIDLKERTLILQQARVPNLTEYNASNPQAALKPIVVVIDEYADLMTVLSRTARQSFEREVNRLAQRARSVGIHMVLATQRPTTDIVTGNLKVNMPCRISFRLPQRVDSGTILDQSGAENLFGKGDMLLLFNDRLSRLQGYYVSPADMQVFLSSRYPGSGYAPALEIEDERLDLSVDDRDRANKEALVGETTGLAVGPDLEDLLDGDVITVEVGLKVGDSAEVTGRSGDVLRQSVLAAWRHVQQNAADYGIPMDRLKNTGVSVHLVNISEYREGPSAGIPFVVAMVSALTGRPVRAGVAMTGEVSLKGKVGQVGGIPQKVVAAYKRGRKVVVVPKANASDLEFVPKEILDRTDIRLVSDVCEAIDIALERDVPKATRAKRKPRA